MYLYPVMKHASVVLLVLLGVAAAQVFLNPSDGQVIFTIHSRADFVCSSVIPDTTSIQWLVNETRIEELMNVQANIIALENGAGLLSFPNLPVEYNMTTIQCVATSRSGTTSSSSTATLILQGLLSAVGSLTFTVQDNANISLTWTAPFSLDITNVDPDITYCVDVVDSISMSTLHSECDLIDTAVNYSLVTCTTGDYTFTIIPENAVGNGTSATVQYSQALTAPRVSEQQLMPLSIAVGVYTYQMTLSSLVCESELTFEDVDTGEEMRLGGSDLIISNNTILFTTAQLNTNRLYSVSVTASNPSGSALSNTTISTHDVTNVHFFGTVEITLQTEYTTISSASGVLYVFLFTHSNGAIDYAKSIYLPLNKTASLSYTLDLLTAGNYCVFAYDIENDGRLRDGVGYPASSNELLIVNRESDLLTNSSIDEECDISSFGYIILAFCTYSAVPGAVGFQMIVQSGNVSEKQRLYVDTTTNQLTPTTVQVPDNGRYHITILYIDRHTGILGATQQHFTILFEESTLTTEGTTTFFTTTADTRNGTIINFIVIGIGAGAGATVLIAVIMTSVCFALAVRKLSNTTKPSSTDHVKPPEPEYEEIGDSPAAFKYTQCPVYGMPVDSTA